MLGADHDQLGAELGCHRANSFGRFAFPQTAFRVEAARAQVVHAVLEGLFDQFALAVGQAGGRDGLGQADTARRRDHRQQTDFRPARQTQLGALTQRYAALARAVIGQQKRVLHLLPPATN